MYVRKCFDFTELKDSDEKIQCLWVTTEGRLKRQISWWEFVTDHPTKVRRYMS